FGLTGDLRLFGGGILENFPTNRPATAPAQTEFDQSASCHTVRASSGARALEHFSGVYAYNLSAQGFRTKGLEALEEGHAIIGICRLESSYRVWSMLSAEAMLVPSMNPAISIPYLFGGPVARRS